MTTSRLSAKTTMRANWSHASRAAWGPRRGPRPGPPGPPASSPRGESLKFLSPGVDAERWSVYLEDMNSTQHTSTTTYHQVPGGHIHRANVPCGSVGIGADVVTITGPADAAALVAEHGSACCTHCFPAAQSHHVAAKAAKAAKAAADGFCTHDPNDYELITSTQARTVRARCNGCGAVAAVAGRNTLRGLRKHKAKKA